MKIVLVNPPQVYPLKFYNKLHFRMHLPVGLLYIAGVLEQAGHEVSVVDAFTLCEGDISHEQGNTIHFGSSWEVLEKKIKGQNPDLVGVTNQYTPQINTAIKIGNIVKHICPDIPVIVGGPHASTRPDDFLFESSGIDFVVMGEGEDIMVELCNSLKNKTSTDGIKGIAYRNDSGIIINPRADYIKDLDRIPFPAYHLIDMNKYFSIVETGLKSRPYIEAKKIVSLITSRGCPFGCIFCSIHLHMGYRWRAHSAEYVLRHIEYLVDQFNVEHICFEDDNFTFNTKRFEAIMDGIIMSGKKITWDPPNGVRADSLNEEQIAKAKMAGATRMVIGIESGDQEVQDKIIGKNLQLKNVIKFADICKKQKINLHGFFMVGFPGETKKNIKNTFNFAWDLMKKYKVIPSFGIAVPLINTKLFKLCEKGGYFSKSPTPENLQLGLHFRAGGLIETEEFNSAYLKKSIREFFIKLLLWHIFNPWRIMGIFLSNSKMFFYKVGRLMNVVFSNKIR